MATGYKNSRRIGTALVDMALSLVNPTVGGVKDVIEAITGNSLLTGEALGTWGRGAAMVGAAVFIGTAIVAPEALPVIGMLGKVLRAGGKAEKVEESINAATKLERAIESLPKGLKVERIRAGTGPERIAVVGRSMGNAESGTVGVTTAADHLAKQGIKAETFAPSAAVQRAFEEEIAAFKSETGSSRLPPDRITQTQAFSENKAWAEKLRESGVTVLDIGNPNSLKDPSPFYDMELSILWPKQ